MKKIVMTGGPCAGKTKVMGFLKSYFSDRGYTVITVPEAATILINSGFSPTLFGVKNFQTAVFKMQIANEETYIASVKDSDKLILVFDRGAVDGAGYIEFDKFIEIINDNGFEFDELYDRYDAVLYMQSVACSNYGTYSTQNNSARFESTEEAAETDKRISDLWKRHKEFIKIPVFETFDEKASLVIDKINNLLS